MRTLLLNASYEPHDVVPARHAVVLVLGDKAEMIEIGSGAFRSQWIALPTPSVIRLHRYVRAPFRTVPLSRSNVLARDEYRCAYCNATADTVDHVVPRSRRGLHVWSNVVAACRRCNATKDNLLLAELGWELHVTPYRPRGTGHWLTLTGRVDPQWEPYLAA